MVKVLCNLSGRARLRAPRAVHSATAGLRARVARRAGGAAISPLRSTVPTLAALCVFVWLSPWSVTQAFAAQGETPETLPATNITSTTAVLNGVLNPHSHGHGEGWNFEYGPGSSCVAHQVHTPGEPEPEGEAQPVRVEVTGLSPATQYTFCIAAGENGASKGKELSFTTRSVVPPPIGSGAEPGDGAGQFEGVAGTALDAAGDVYVVDRGNRRIDKFNSAGSFVLAWGWRVNRESPVDELQTCTTASGCREGESGQGAGEFSFEGPQGVAVDGNEPSTDSSAGDVYVVDWENYRVEKFDGEGHFLSMFGGEVNEGKDNTPGATQAEKDVCLAGEKCMRGTPGSGDGQFEWANASNGIVAVGPGGKVYVGDKARVEVFEPSGVWRESISLAGLSSEGKVTSLAVDSAGDVFVVDQGVPGVREFEPDGTEALVKFDEVSESIEGVAVDDAGDVFVADATGALHIVKYGAAGGELDSFGSYTAARSNGIAFSDALAKEQLYVSNAVAPNVWVLRVPPPGPLIVPSRESAAPGLRGAGQFEASVNPEGNATEVAFEYVDAADFHTTGFASAASTAASAIGSSFEGQPVEATLPAKTLVPGVTYYWRPIATDSAGHRIVGEEQSFEETPSIRLEGPWVQNVASTSATLRAQIDPLGTSTEYRLEWGTSSSYGNVHSGSVGEGVDVISVSFEAQGLDPDTTYHYRLVTTSEFGTVEGADQAFTTQSGGEVAALPDGRVWELVSPTVKHGALIQPTPQQNQIQAAGGGGAIVYEATDAIGENPQGKIATTPVLSRRGPNGWRSEDIAIPQNLPPEGAEPSLDLFAEQRILFSTDLSLGVVAQGIEPQQPLSGEATQRTPYLRDEFTCAAQPTSCYTPLVTPKNVEPSTVNFGGLKNSSEEVNVAGGSPDLSHMILSSPLALTAGATAGVCTTSCNEENLYEWSGGQLQPVNILPGATTTTPGATLGEASIGNDPYALVDHTVSSDGRWVVWSLGDRASSGHGEGKVELYVRDMASKQTIRIGGEHPEYQTMTSDGSRVFFIENGELYEVDVNTDVQTDLTVNHLAGEATAGVQNAILGTSEDGSYVYFVANGVLTDNGLPVPGAVPGTCQGGAVEGHDAASGALCNLYVMHREASGWSTADVATLSGEDEHSWYANYGNNSGPVVDRAHVSSRVSPNGRYVTFMSDRPLTGYDNRDATSGQPDEEVYLYDAAAGRLICASCNPTGARPAGVLDTEELLVDEGRTWGRPLDDGLGERWVAGIIPSWYTAPGPASEQVMAAYQPRFLLDDGRLFFESSDGLVAQATNGRMDVYEYEPAGVGSCGEGSGTFHQATGGCTSLISSGTASGEAVFYDASESGDDVFFVTASRLVSEDQDTALDVYDAHVCSAAAPCAAAPAAVPPPCASGDACKPAASPQPETFGAPSSETFSGGGNLPAPPATGKANVSRSKKCKRGQVMRKGGCVRQRARADKRKKQAGRKHKKQAGHYGRAHR